MRKVLPKEELPQLVDGCKWIPSPERGWGITDIDGTAWIYATERGIYVIPSYDGYEFEITQEMVAAVRAANGWLP